MNNTNDLIPRDAAIAAFDDERVDRNYGDVSPESVIRVIESISPVDAVPVVHARWIRQKGSAHVFKCSACGFVFAGAAGAAIAKYCPNCGAKMDD